VRAGRPGTARTRERPPTWRRMGRCHDGGNLTIRSRLFTTTCSPTCGTGLSAHFAGSPFELNGLTGLPTGRNWPSAAYAPPWGVQDVPDLGLKCQVYSHSPPPPAATPGKHRLNKSLPFGATISFTFINKLMTSPQSNCRSAGWSTTRWGHLLNTNIICCDQSKPRWSIPSRSGNINITCVRQRGLAVGLSKSSHQASGMHSRTAMEESSSCSRHDIPKRENVGRAPLAYAAPTVT
jgi:hypothetical protein